MSIIPIITKPLDDELLYSWIHRLAIANGLHVCSFQEAYINKKAVSIGSLKSDVKNEFVTLYDNMYIKDDMMNFYLSLSTFQFECIMMTRGQQTRYINNVFRPSDKLNSSVNALFKSVKICQACVANETIPYIHRAHQLSGVCTCHKHGCKLLEYKGKKGHEMEFKLNDYEEISSEKSIDVLNAYTRYVQKLFETAVNTDIKTIKRVLYDELIIKGYSVTDEYQTFLDDIKEWKYKELFCVNIKSFLKIKMITAEHIAAQDVIPFLMFLFPDVHALIDKISDDEAIVESYFCENCNKEYVATPLSVRDGWGCPYCDVNISEEIRFEKIIQRTSNGEYKPISKFSAIAEPVVFYHNKCSQKVKIKPREFLFESRRCICENIITEPEAKREVEKNKGFKLVKFCGAERTATFFHETCERTFDCKYRKFIKFPSCRKCKPKVMTTELFERRIKDLVGDEYSIVKGFVDQDTKIILKHKVCGEQQSYKPSHFLEGQRCSNCHQTIAFSELQEMLTEYSNGKYSIIAYAKNIYTIQNNETGDEIKLSSSKIQQEMLRPTPSDVLPVDNKVEVNIPLSQWEIGFKNLNEYKEKFGTVNVPKQYVYNGYSLGYWCGRQRKDFRSGKLGDDKINLLNSIGFVFDPLETEWIRRYDQYRRYIKDYDTTYITRRADYEGEHLGAWVETQRKRFSEGKLSKQRIEQLKELSPDFFEKKL